MSKTLANATIEELAKELLAKVKSEIISELHHEIEEEFRRQFDSHDVPDKFLTRQEVADALGVSLPTVHSMMNKGKIPFVKIGASTRIPKSQFDEALKKGLRRYQHKHRPRRTDNINNI